MFTLEGKLTFINIGQSHLKKLYDACSEVYYKPSGYENKPYIEILINKNDRKYVIPLSSAKEKHKTWENVDKECYWVYEMAKKSSMGQGDIWATAACMQIYCPRFSGYTIPQREIYYYGKWST